jgi:hypothetical protein
VFERDKNKVEVGAYLIKWLLRLLEFFKLKEYKQLLYADMDQYG